MILFKGKKNDLATIFPPILTINHQVSVRNGVSTRSKLLIGFYDIALYLGKMTEDAETAIFSNDTKQLRMVARREIKGKLLEKAFKRGLKDNCTPEDYQRFEAVIDEAFGQFFATDSIKEGEIFMIDISPTQGVRLFYESNADLPYTQVDGFAAALLKIWLGEKPVSESIKQDLLGLRYVAH